MFEGNHQLTSFGRLDRHSVAGVSYLAPAEIDPSTIDLLHPHAVTREESFPRRSTPPGFDAETADVIQRPSHVEIVATGPSGTRVDIAWTDTCGMHRPGKSKLEYGGVGGHGQMRAVLPAVLVIKLPRWATGQDSCYVGTTLLTNTFQPGLSVRLINS